MSELINRKAVEHNDLITSVAKMDKTSLKIFSLAVSCIDTDNPPKDHTVYLSKRELFAFFDASDNDKNYRFKQAMDRMQKQAYFNVRKVEGERLEFENIVPIPHIKWNNYNDAVSIRFDVAIMPYLIDLKENFTQIDMLDLIDLGSKYSVILYKWLIMNYNQYEHYKFKGNRTTKQLEELENPKISMEELRRITDTSEEYIDFRNFERRVLKKPIKEINQHTKLNVSYEKIKGGKFIKEIHFHLDKKPVAKNEFYKEEQQDPAFLQDEKENERAFNKAIDSPYTEFLGDNMLIGFKDIRDKELMANLQKTVYPMYDELERLKGMGSVKKHISYVASRKKDYSKKNIVKYLHESIQNYLPRAR